ncbi:hypothetical protein F7P69_24180 [Cellulosimicrobium funkei]|nr:hypothetical protein [Cellulosimicrobium funkei]
MSTEPKHQESPESAENQENEENQDRKTSRGPDTEQELDEQVEDSFPASDPPANY